MNRLIWIAIAVCVVLSACGGQANAPKDTSSPLVVSSEKAVLGGVTPVDERIALALETPVPPAMDALPQLPSVIMPERQASATLSSNRNGADYYSDLKSTNATVEGTSLHLLAASGELSWAIYQFAVDPGAALTKLTVNASDGNFTGDWPGYWVGLADFMKGSWSGFSQMHTTVSPFVKTYPNLAVADYLSPNNYIYIAVLVDSQEVTIDSLSLEYELAAWQHIEFGEGANNAGWTPALAYVTGTSALMAVYSDFDTGKARYGVWDGTSDMTEPVSWAFMDVDPLRTDTPDVLGSTCKWLDMTQDPATGYPRVSFIYEGVPGGNEDSIIGFSVYVKGGNNQTLFLNYRMGNPVYGGGYTSIDRDPVDGAYVVAHYVSNEGSAPPDDMHLRVFQINDPNKDDDDESIDVTKNFFQLFGIPCYFPHVRCLPDGSNLFSVNGGNIYALNTEGYLEYNLDQDSNALGSVAYSPDNSWWGFTYAKQSGSQTLLRFIEDLDNPSAPVHDVDTMNGTNWIGASQLAYQPDGNPAIAYTRFDGSGVDVMLAEYDGAQWNLETVSTTPCLPADTTDRESVLVDLDYNLNGEPALIWNQVNGASCVAHIAQRQT